MEDGTYRLTRDLPAPKPDKRMRHDWRAQPVKAGELFVVVTVPSLAHTDGTTVQEIRPLYGAWAHQSLMLHDWPTDSLERVAAETAEMWLRRTGNKNWALETLTELVDSGVITLGQVQYALKNAQAKAES